MAGLLRLLLGVVVEVEEAAVVGEVFAGTIIDGGRENTLANGDVNKEEA